MAHFMHDFVLYLPRFREPGIEIICGTSSQNKFYPRPGNGIVKGNLQDVLTNKQVYNWSLMLYNDIPKEGECIFSL